MFFIFKANTPEHQSLFQTGWFVEGLLSQTLIVHIIRTKKIPFIQSWAAAPVVALTSLIMLMGVSIPFTPIAGYLKMQPLPLSYFLIFWEFLSDTYPDSVCKTMVYPEIPAMVIKVN